MAQVTLTVGDRAHVVACADGGEVRLAGLGRMLDERWVAARRAVGNGGTERELLLIALMLADELDEARNAPSLADGVDIDALAERLERLVEALENAAPNA